MLTKQIAADNLVAVRCDGQDAASCQSAPASPFATLQRVDLRNGWIDEARGLTPGLADWHNLRMLGNTIGLEHACEAVEKPVGPFSADILCRDTDTGAWVLIENQLERTITPTSASCSYAAGLKAATIVWVVRQFRASATETQSNE